MIRVQMVYDVRLNTHVIAASEEHAGRFYSLQADKDGYITAVEIQRGAERKMLMQFDGVSLLDFLQAFVNEAANVFNIYPARQVEGILEHVTDGRTDARETRDRLFTLVEKLTDK